MSSPDPTPPPSPARRGDGPSSAEAPVATGATAASVSMSPATRAGAGADDAQHAGVSVRTVVIALQVAVLFVVFSVLDPLGLSRRQSGADGAHHRHGLSAVVVVDGSLLEQPTSTPAAAAATGATTQSDAATATSMPLTTRVVGGGASPTSTVEAAGGTTEALPTRTTSVAPTTTAVPSSTVVGGTGAPSPTSSTVVGGTGAATAAVPASSSVAAGGAFGALERSVYLDGKPLPASRALRPFDPDAPLDVQYARPFTTEQVQRRPGLRRLIAAALRAAEMNTSLAPAPSGSGGDGDDEGYAAPPRVLMTDGFAGKYGLNNILISAASMLMYGAMDERAVHFPRRVTPVHMETLLDLNATETLLRPANVVVLSDAEFDALYGPSPRTYRARKAGISFGYRRMSGSGVRSESQNALNFQRSMMKKSAAAGLFAHRDFFLNIPSRALAPLDICFFLKRMVFHYNVRSMAQQLLRSLRDDKGAKTFLAFHLRLEFDATLVKREAGSVSPEELERYLDEDLMPLATRAGVDAVYICAGKLNAKVMAVLKGRKHAKPIYLKTDFPNIKVPMVDEKTVVTSHVGAAVDAVVMKHAQVAVGLSGSTFGFGTLSFRCPSPSRAAAGPTNDLRKALKQFTWFGGGTSKLVTPEPKAVGLVAETASELGRRESAGAEEGAAFEGMFYYDYSADAKFTKMRYAPCEEPERWCYWSD